MALEKERTSLQQLDPVFVEVGPLVDGFLVKKWERKLRRIIERLSSAQVMENEAIDKLKQMSWLGERIVKQGKWFKDTFSCLLPLPSLLFSPLEHQMNNLTRLCEAVDKLGGALNSLQRTYSTARELCLAARTCITLLYKVSPSIHKAIAYSACFGVLLRLLGALMPRYAHI